MFLQVWHGDFLLPCCSLVPDLWIAATYLANGYDAEKEWTYWLICDCKLDLDPVLPVSLMKNPTFPLAWTVVSLKPASCLGSKWRIKSYFDLRDYLFSGSRCNRASDATLTQLVWKYIYTAFWTNSHFSLSTLGGYIYHTTKDNISNSEPFPTATFVCMPGNLVWVCSIITWLHFYLHMRHML